MRDTGFVESTVNRLARGKIFLFLVLIEKYFKK